MKKIIIPIVAVGFVAFLGLVLAAGCVVSGHGWHFGQSWNNSEQATRSDTLALALAEGGTLEITLAAGDVTLQAGAGAQPELKARITTYGQSTEEAKKRLDEAHVVVEQTASGARIHLEPEQSQSAGVFVQPRADLQLRIPGGVKLDVHLGSGDIVTRGAIASSQLHSSYGDLKIEEASGDLALESDSGSIQLGALTAAQSLSARSSYGDVSARHVEAQSVKLHSSSGDVSLSDAQCAAAELDSQYGNVSLERVSGDVDAKTSSGDVKAETLDGKSAQLKSGYGSVHLRGFTGTVTASSSSGDVALEGVQGACDARSGYGSVRIEGVLTRVAAHSQSGSVHVTAKASSQPDDDWKLSSGYGDVELVLPRELGFELSAKTGYGELDIQVPLMIEAGALKEKHALRGKVGSGGRTISLSTSSGDVRVVTQPH